MSQTCTVCRHAKRWDIEKAIIDGESLRDIARHFRLSKDAVARHKARLPNTLGEARADRPETALPTRVAPPIWVETRAPALRCLLN